MLAAVADPADYDPATVTPEEKDYLDAVAAWYADDGGYEHEQMTRPQMATAWRNRPAGSGLGAGPVTGRAGTRLARGGMRAGWRAAVS